MQQLSVLEQQELQRIQAQQAQELLEQRLLAGGPQL
jgi:hypothetical protein